MMAAQGVVAVMLERSFYFICYTNCLLMYSVLAILYNPHCNLSIPSVTFGVASKKL